MSAPVKLTAAQRRALAFIGSRRQVSTGVAGSLHEIAGSTFTTLFRRGLVSREYNAIFDSTHYQITDAGRAALAASKDGVAPATSTWEVREVLAGAYAGGSRSNPKTMLTHLVRVTGAGEDDEVLCGRVSIDSICDRNVGGEPTCKVCLRRAAKWFANVPGGGALETRDGVK